MFSTVAATRAAFLRTTTLGALAADATTMTMMTTSEVPAAQIAEGTTATKTTALAGCRATDLDDCRASDAAMMTATTMSVKRKNRSSNFPSVPRGVPSLPQRLQPRRRLRPPLHLRQQARVISSISVAPLLHPRQPPSLRRTIFSHRAWLLRHPLRHPLLMAGPPSRPRHPRRPAGMQAGMQILAQHSAQNLLKTRASATLARPPHQPTQGLTALLTSAGCKPPPHQPEVRSCSETGGSSSNKRKLPLLHQNRPRRAWTWVTS
mmetsp:Transcript_42319/g.91999  ORF Transcript_42319/g.91999 Transcript_42319/m.91999 type:complete len:263 (+) Transcript_42319:504-1292(+)